MTTVPHSYPEGCVFTSLADIRGKHITVMGLGLNGGGKAAVGFFLKYGAYVIVTDMKTEEQLKPTIDAIKNDSALDKSRLVYHLGKHRIEDFSSADCVIKNPGIKYEGNKYLAAAKAIETDLSIFLAFTKAPVIAVTGSKGKSSTVSAIHYGLRQAGVMAFLGGNITLSPLDFLCKTNETTPVILELSSWQLADLRGRKSLKPRIAVITKIVPDHQNWYSNMEDYVADKRLIYADQTPDCFSIFDADEDEPGTGPVSGGTWGNLFAAESHATILRYSRHKLLQGQYGVWQESGTNKDFYGRLLLPDSQEPVTILRSLAVPGQHMRTNVLNAALAMVLMGIKPEHTADILSKWEGIPHRLQYFHSWKCADHTVKFYNDSCATVPEAAAAASQSFGKPVVFITGGTDKGLPQNVLAETLAGIKQDSIPVKSLYLLSGTATDKLMPLLNRKNVPYNGPYNSLAELLTDLKAYEVSLSGSLEDDETIVFSPGATSFGMFANEFDRGDKYMDAVKSLFT
ncbi:MAG: UDP-N-acetylmuramoyl-L-alanine--D-glutamate ligase [Treponema sp.]